MTSLKELPQDHMVILLASRFDLNEGGHFYWYTKEMITELNMHHPNYLVLSPPILGDELPNFIDAHWQFIDDLSAWGHDTGIQSPKKLVKKMLPILDSLGKSESITLISFESSLSMIVALLELQRRVPVLQISVNLLDHGFWLKLLSTKVPIVRFLIRDFTRILQNANESFKLLHPSLSQVDSFSRLLGFRVFPFSHISAFWKFSSMPLQTSPNETRVLILPWSADLDHVKKFIDSVFMEIGVTFRAHIHFKTLVDLQYFREHIRVETFDKIDYSVGVLSLHEYISLFKQSDLAWIPYTDFYHQITGSGRAFDCLTLGCPLIIDQKSDLALMVANFPLIFLCPDSNTSWISKYIDLIRKEKSIANSYLERRLELEKLGANLFSPLNGINSFLKPLDSNVKHHNHSFMARDFHSLVILYHLTFFLAKIMAVKKWCLNSHRKLRAVHYSHRRLFTKIRLFKS